MKGGIDMTKGTVIKVDERGIQGKVKSDDGKIYGLNLILFPFCKVGLRVSFYQVECEFAYITGVY